MGKPAGFKPGVRPIRHLRWWIIGLVMVGTAVNYLARSALGSAAPTLTKELSMSTQAYSYVVAAFQLAYTVVQPLAGWILDLLGAKVGLFIFAIGWSLANMAHALATGWPSLAVFRGLLGLFEGAVIPAGMKAVSDWFPDKERSVATGWFNVGTAIGSMAAPPLVVWCILAGSWRLAFVVTGAIGLVWAGLWLAVYRRPQEHRRLAPEELVYIEAGQVPDAPLSEAERRGGWKVLLRDRNLWAIALPRFLADPAWQTFTFWIPLYLVTVRGMDLKQIAAFAWLPFLAADLGSIAGGYLSPALMRLGVPLLTARKLTILTGSVLMIGPACIAFAPNAYWAIALFCVGGFAHQMLSGTLITLSADVFPKHQVATATGMAGTAAWTGGLLFSLLVGALATTIGYNPLFVCLAIFDLLGSAIVWSLLRKPAAACHGA